MTETTGRPRRGPTLIEDTDLEGPSVSPADAPPVDDIADDPQAGAAAAAAIRLSGGRAAPGIGTLFWAALLALLSLVVGAWFWEVVAGLMAKNLWLGRAVLVLAAIVALSLVVISLRELAALARLRRADALRDGAARAFRNADRGAALSALDMLDGFYRGRADLAAAKAGFAAQRGDVVDGDELILLAERHYMPDLDRRAQEAARRGARTVAAATAMLPVALIDVLVVLTINLRMIREIAEIYGGRAGWLGSWRLLRAVSAHLVAAGAISIGDDLIGPALGGGALAKISRRFGEGVVNGALTARIGVAAMEVCRPLPFEACKRPGVAGLISGALVSGT